MNVDEYLFLAATTGSKTGKLLYRATRDGFTCTAFHSYALFSDIALVLRIFFILDYATVKKRQLQ